MCVCVRLCLVVSAVVCCSVYIYIYISLCGSFSLHIHTHTHTHTHKMSESVLSVRADLLKKSKIQKIPFIYLF